MKVDTPVYIFVESSGDLTRSDAKDKVDVNSLMKKKIYSDERYLRNQQTRIVCKTSSKR